MLVSERIGQLFLSSGDRLEFTEYGGGERWVVLLHAELMTRRMYQPLARRLAGEGFHVLCLDLLGHGRSDRPSDPLAYSVTAYAEQVEALLDEVGADQALLVGVSVGANVALETAVRSPGRVRGLLLESPVLDNAFAAGLLRLAPLMLGPRRCRWPSPGCAGWSARCLAGWCPSGWGSPSTPATSVPGRWARWCTACCSDGWPRAGRAPGDRRPDPPGRPPWRPGTPVGRRGDARRRAAPGQRAQVARPAGVATEPGPAGRGGHLVRAGLLGRPQRAEAAAAQLDPTLGRHNGGVPLYRDEAVVLRTDKLGEADRIITLLTRHHGRVRAVAKGVRRTTSRWGSRLEPFTHVDLQLAEGRSLDTITQAETLTPFHSGIGLDYDRYTAGTVMLETAGWWWRRRSPPSSSSCCWSEGCGRW